ncbi:MAG: N-acetylglucosamine kinase, partial [Candidatus Acidiferrales bacterium]
MGFFLGIDGGGSKTECVLGDASGAVLARALGAGANLRRTDATSLRQLLSDCFRELRRSASLHALDCDVVCAGFAGAGQPEPQQMARAVLAELLRPRWLYVLGDMEVALEAAVGGGCGVVLLAGTGSIAYGRNGKGEVARAGGEGPARGDEGSGYAIGRAAVEAVLRAGKGRAPETRLTKPLC